MPAAPGDHPLPTVALVRRFDTHRLIPSRYLANGDSVLVAIADDDDHLQAIFELDAAPLRRAALARASIRTATSPRRRWPSACSRPARSASSIRAFAARAGRASPVSGRRW